MEHTIPLSRIEEAIHGDCISCSEYHGDSCVLDIMPKRFARTTELMSVTYLPIHIIPFLLFKRKRVLKNPVDQIKKLLKGYVKSVLFASSYTSLLGFFLCKMKVLTGDMNGVKIVPISAFMSGIALVLENETRRQQIALFLVPKRRGLIKPLPHAQAILFGLATAILLYFYQHTPQHIKSGYRSVMKKLFGEDV